MEFTKTKKEQAEDALFTVLLDSVLQLEGQRLDALPQPLEPMPDMIDRSALSTIQRQFDLLQFGGRARIRTKRILRYILIAAAILATLLTITYASRSADRAGDLELSVDKRPYGIDFGMFDALEKEQFERIPREKVDPAKLLKEGYSFPLAPEGYLYDPFASFQNNINWIHESQPQEILFSVYEKMPENFLNYDNTLYEEIEVCGQPGWRTAEVHSTERTSVSIGWTDQTTGKFLLVVGTNTDFDTVSALAQQITYVGE